MPIIEFILGIIWFFWPFAWIVVLFLKGYSGIKYPEHQDNQAEKKKAKLWLIVSLVAIFAWGVFPFLS